MSHLFSSAFVALLLGSYTKNAKTHIKEIFPHVSAKIFMISGLVVRS